MNTKVMFNEAMLMRLTRFQLVGHCLWAIVSQTGSRELSVGEITKLVGLTSGIRPSTYQVKDVMTELYEMGAAQKSSGSNKGKGVETKYASDTRAIALLTCYTAAFWSTPLYDAVIALVNEIAIMSREKHEELKKYNKQLEAENE